MAEQQADKQLEQAQKLQKNVRAVFPRIGLLKVLELAQNIYELGEGDPVPRLVVFDKMKKSPDSGPSRMLITTSNAYGLTTGSYKAERLAITDRGRAILSNNSKIRFQTASDILLSNDIFRQFYEKYVNRQVPPEPVAIDFLKQIGQLGETDAKSAYAVVIENLRDFGFIKELSGRPTIIPMGMISNTGSSDSTAKGHEDEEVEGNDTEEAPSQASPVKKQLENTPEAGLLTQELSLLRVPISSTGIVVLFPGKYAYDLGTGAFSSGVKELAKNASEIKPEVGNEHAPEL